MNIYRRTDRNTSHPYKDSPNRNYKDSPNRNYKDSPNTSKNYKNDSPFYKDSPNRFKDSPNRFNDSPRGGYSKDSPRYGSKDSPRYNSKSPRGSPRRRSPSRSPMNSLVCFSTFFCCIKFSILITYYPFFTN